MVLISRKLVALKTRSESAKTGAQKESKEAKSLRSVSLCQACSGARKATSNLSYATPSCTHAHAAMPRRPGRS